MLGNMAYRSFRSMERSSASSVLIFSMNTDCESLAYQSFRLIGVHLEVSATPLMDVAPVIQVSTRSGLWKRGLSIL